MRKISLCLALTLTLLCGRAQAFTPTEDGLYAVFDTSMGEFTCELFYKDTTQTVANFVGLAEGSIDWLDLETGYIQRNHPFYDGTIFHRIISFGIQGGSPNGEGTDGPGYNIYDEIVVDDPTYSFTRTGLIAMANTGRANSGGAQFFVTTEPATHLENKHTIFGEVVDGQSVVDAINQVPTTNEKPDEDVVINSLTIIREGDAAQAFDPTAYDVPTLGNAELIPIVGVDEYFLNTDLQPYFQYFVYQSTDLESWLNIGQLPRIFTDTGRQDLSIGAGLPAATYGFWQGVRAVYPDIPNGGVTIEVSDTSTTPDELAFTLVLNEDLTGSFTPEGGNEFEISYYAWHEFGDDNTTLYIQGPSVRPLQFYFKGSDTGEAVLFLETSGSFPEDIIENLSYEISPTN